MSSAPSSGPGIRFPPPLYFVTGGLAAWLLHRRLPFEIDGKGVGDVQWILGMLLLAAGVGVMAWGIGTLLSSDTAIRPDRPASRLVTAGPYRRSRNPIYCGMTAIYLGAAILANAAWAVAVLPAVLALLAARVIRREERHLRELFGDEYEAYCRRVRRWV